MIPIPSTIRKHWFGAIAWILGGTLLAAAFWFAMWDIYDTGALTFELYWMLGAFSIVVLLLTAVQVYVYGLSSIELDSDGVTVKNWTTLFVSKDEQFEWTRITRATVFKGNIIAQLLNFGTLQLETEGGHVLVAITMVPDIEAVQQIIQMKADEATVDGTD